MKLQVEISLYLLIFRSSHLLVLGILVTLVACIFCEFFPSCPSCLAECKKDYVIFLSFYNSVTKTDQKRKTKNGMTETLVYKLSNSKLPQKSNFVWLWEWKQNQYWFSTLSSNNCAFKVLHGAPMKLMIVLKSSNQRYLYLPVDRYMLAQEAWF